MKLFRKPGLATHKPRPKSKDQILQYHKTACCRHFINVYLNKWNLIGLGLDLVQCMLLERAMLCKVTWESVSDGSCHASQNMPAYLSIIDHFVLLCKSHIYLPYPSMQIFSIPCVGKRFRCIALRTARETKLAFDLWTSNLSFFWVIRWSCRWEMYKSQTSMKYSTQKVSTWQAKLGKLKSC